MKEITHPKAVMSENGEQFAGEGRKPGSTCKLHPVSQNNATLPDEREREPDRKWLYMQQLPSFICITTSYLPHGVRFHPRGKGANAIITVNMAVGMDDSSSSSAARPLPSSVFVWGKMKQHITSVNFIVSLFGWLVIIIITMIITHLALVAFVAHERRCILSLFTTLIFMQLYSAVLVFHGPSVPPGTQVFTWDGRMEKVGHMQKPSISWQLDIEPVLLKMKGDTHVHTHTLKSHISKHWMYFQTFHTSKMDVEWNI